MTGSALCIVRYEDKQGFAGKLLGVLTLPDRTLKVWESNGRELHKQCKQLAAFPPHEITYEFKHSEKWGDSLTKIASSKTDAELYDLQRTVDERRGGPALKHNTYGGRRLRDAVQRQVETERGDHKTLMERG